MQAPITPADLQKFAPELANEVADAMIETSWVRAQRIAPCLADGETSLTEAESEIVKDVLRGAILRWNDRGSGAVTQRNAGDYGETLKASDSTLFRPNEIRDLQAVCKDYRRRGRASTISTIPPGYYEAPTVHPFLTGTEQEYPAEAWGL